MRRIVDALAPLGLLVMIGAGAWARAGKTLPGKPEYYTIAGLVLIVAHLLLRWDDLARLVGRRQAKYGANTLLAAVAVAGVLGGGNYLVYKHTKRWDLTKNQRYSLSDQTKKVLANLKDDVKIIYFDRATNLAAGQDRLKEYQAASPRIKTEFVDPLKDPTKAQSYDARGPWPSIVVERASVREKISNDSEQDITNAIIKVTHEKKKTVCFEEGEGERDLEDGGDGGFSAAKSALGKSQYETQKVALLREQKVPATCSVFVVAGPQKDLLQPEIDAIRSFVKAGGKALIMVEPEMKESYPNLTGLLKEWNIETQKDVVLDVSGMGQLFGTGPLTPLALQYPSHEITRDFSLATAFHMARSVQAGTGHVDGVTTQNLVETSQASWAETDLTLKEPVGMDEGKDRKGPISLGAVATITASTPDSPSPGPSPSPAAGTDAAKPEGRVVAFGDSDFASNALLGFQGNQDFLLNTVAWLAQDADLISIRARDVDDQRLFVTRDQQANVWWLSIVLIPGLFIVLGVAAWWRRR